MKVAIALLLSSREYKNEYGVPCTTLAGERVKSKGEKIIADFLFTKKIRYEYEKMALTDEFWLFQEKIGKPDFYLSDYDVYVEYWGLIDAKDPRVKKEYRKLMNFKTKKYRDNNIKFISIYPSEIGRLEKAFFLKLGGLETFDNHVKKKNHRDAQSQESTLRDTSEEQLEKIIGKLGDRCKKLELFDEGDGIRFKAKVWLEKQEWLEINSILRAGGFDWLPNGKDSCWIRM